MITLIDLGLQKFEKNKQYQKYLKALNKFIEKKSKNKNFTHIFVGGSFVTGKLNEFSDLDCYLIDPKGKSYVEKHENILGVKVDYLILSEKIIKEQFSHEKNTNFRNFSYGISILKRVYGNNSFNKLIVEAKKILKLKISALPKSEINNMNIFLENQKREPLNMYKQGDIIGFHLRTSHVIHSCVYYYFSKNRLLAASWKKMSSSIKDNKFKSLLKSALLEKDDMKKHKKVNKLIDYVIQI